MRRGAARSGEEIADPPRSAAYDDVEDLGGKDHEVPIGLATLLEARWRGQKITMFASGSVIMVFWKDGALLELTRVVGTDAIKYNVKSRLTLKADHNASRDYAANGINTLKLCPIMLKSTAIGDEEKRNLCELMRSKYLLQGAARRLLGAESIRRLPFGAGGRSDGGEGARQSSTLRRLPRLLRET